MEIDHLLSPLVQRLERSVFGRKTLRVWRKYRNPIDLGKQRVLCVGFVKTGTSSFGKAMRLLGYSHYGYDPDLEKSLVGGDVECCLRWASYFNSLDDLPWSRPEFIAAYRDRFPGSYYVFLERNEQEWLGSYFRYYGVISSEKAALERLRSHQNQVREILKNETHVLQMNICAGDGYEKLCPFLGIPVPSQPFPWVIPKRQSNR